MSQPVTAKNEAANDISSYIALGGNVTSPFGPPETTLRAALARVESDSVRVARVSRFYRSPAFPMGSGPDFVNAVAELRSGLPATVLLAHLHSVEAEMGRDRLTRWAARTIDLDLIAHGAEIHPDAAGFDAWRLLPLAEQQSRAPDGLILPHPRLQDRAFVLGPLCDVAPDWVHPVLGQTAAALFEALAPADRAALAPLPDAPAPPDAASF